MQVNQESLAAFLKEKGYEAKIQAETGQVYVIFNILGREFPLFLRIIESGELLQLLAFMPCKIKPGTQNDLGRLLHLMNKELDIPGFGMDENSNVAFYRLILPISGKQIDEKLLENYLKTVSLVCETLSSPVIAVASGLTSYQDILKKAKDLGQGIKLKP